MHNVLTARVRETRETKVSDSQRVGALALVEFAYEEIASAEVT